MFKMSTNSFSTTLRLVQYSRKFVAVLWKVPQIDCNETVFFSSSVFFGIGLNKFVVMLQLDNFYT